MGPAARVTEGLTVDDLQLGAYGYSLQMRDLDSGCLVQTLDRGASHQVVPSVSRAPTESCTWIRATMTSNADLSAIVWLWHRTGDGTGTCAWTARKVIGIPAEPAAGMELPAGFAALGAVPPLVSHVALSPATGCCRSAAGAQVSSASTTCAIPSTPSSPSSSDSAAWRDDKAIRSGAARPARWTVLHRPEPRRTTTVRDERPASGLGPELLIDGLHALGIGLDGEHGRIERRLDRPATPLPAKPVTRVVHEDLTHRHGGYREEVPATRPRRTVVVRELQIGLVDQRRGLHPVVGAHPASLAARYTTQVLVDERDELIERASVTPTIRIEQLRHVTGYWTVLRVAATPRES